MKTYYVHWIDEELESKPSMKGSPKPVEAATPKDAWETFYKRYPNLKDGEGDYYVMIRTQSVPMDDETDVVAEAGVAKGKPYFRPWKEGLPL